MLMACFICSLVVECFLCSLYEKIIIELSTISIPLVCIAMSAVLSFFVAGKCLNPEEPMVGTCHIELTSTPGPLLFRFHSQVVPNAAILPQNLSG